MKKYIAPEIELARFSTKDVITSSDPVIKLTINEEKPAVYDGTYANMAE